MNKLLQELQRRNVIKSSISYVALSWVFLEGADIIFPVIGVAQEYIKFVLILLIVGFPFWVVFAYIFEWTPSGFRKTDDVKPEKSIAQTTSKRLNSYIIIGLSLAVTLLLADRIFNITGGSDAGNIEKSIAVLPFTNMSNDPDQEYFSDGLTDDILTQLAKIDEFRVISRTSVMQYKDSPTTITEIGRKLNVGLILEGSVQKSGDQVRITAQLINAKTDEHIWAESYDRPISDLFKIQREVALAIADITKAKLSPSNEEKISAIPTENIEAYQLYQRGKYYLEQPHFSKQEWEKAIGYFNEAVQLDPNFAEVYGQLAKCHARLYNLKSDRTETRKNMAKDAAEKAISLDAHNPNIQLAIGYYYLWALEDNINALSYFEFAAEKLENNVEVLIAKASLYEAKGEWGKYIKSYEKGVAISPLDLGCIVNLAFGYFYIQQYEKALEYNAMATNIAPEGTWNHLTRAFISFSEEGPSNESRNALEKIDKDHDWYLWAFYYQELFEGNFQAALDLVNQYPNGVNHKMTIAPKEILLAHIYAVTAREELAKVEYKKALEILEESIKSHPDDHRYQSALGLAHAGLGNRTEAIEAGKKAIEILPLSKNAFYGVPPLLEMALIYDMLGESDLALDHLETVLSIPNYFTVEWLKRDVRYENIRTNPRYDGLISTYAVSYFNPAKL